MIASRDEVSEEGVNIWASGEYNGAKPKVDIFLVHGLSSHPYWAWHHPPPSSKHRTSSVSSYFDSSLSLGSSSVRRSIFTAKDGIESPVISSPRDPERSNPYGETDVFGRIGTFWPRDFLPNSIPNARICTVGYKSRWTSSKFQPSLTECGEHLLTVLDHERNSRDAQNRPLIFVAHSFGGLVVQSALISARVNQRFGKISRALAGCLFIGCPFRGTEAVSLLSTVTSMAGNNQDILNLLRPGNQELAVLQKDFMQLYSSVPMVCFYERLKSELGKTMMVGILGYVGSTNTLC